MSQAPTRQITLDKVRTLKFDFEGATQFEAVTGKNFLSQDAWQGISATTMIALLWALLLHEDPELTREDVGRMVHMNNISEVASALADMSPGAAKKKRAKGA